MGNNSLELYRSCNNNYYILTRNVWIKILAHNQKHLRVKGSKITFLFSLPYSGKCERQWQTFGDSIYQICKVRTDKWIDAQAACQNIGANLVKIETRAENEFLTRITKTLKMQNSWLGLRRGWDNWFYWSDGSRPTYRNWLPSGPKHFEGREYCVNLKDNGKWSDVFCDAMPRVYNYICEKSK